MHFLCLKKALPVFYGIVSVLWEYGRKPPVP